MNKNIEENVFLSEKVYDEILKKLESIPWLKEYAEQLPAEFIMKILQLYGAKYEIKQLNDSIVRFQLRGTDFEYYFAEPLVGIRVIVGNMNGIEALNTSFDSLDIQLRCSVIHYCVKGRCEIMTRDGMYAFMQPGVLCVESQKHKNKNFNFYGEDYIGVEIAFDLDRIGEDTVFLLKQLGLDVEKMIERNAANADYYIGTVSEKLKLSEENVMQLMKSESTDRISLLIGLADIWDKIRTGHVKTNETQFYLTKGQRKIVKEIYESIMADPSKDVTVDGLSKKYKLSSVSLNKYFGVMYGSTVHKFIQEYRMEKAAELLTTSDRSVAEIALMVGYENQGKFGNVFKRKYGMTPLEYRRLKH